MEDILQDAWQELQSRSVKASRELELKLKGAQQALTTLLASTDVMCAEWNKWVPQDETAERQIRFRTWYGSQLHYIHESLQELTQLKLGEPSVEGLTAWMQEEEMPLEPLGEAEHLLRATAAKLVDSIARIVDPGSPKSSVVDAAKSAISLVTDAGWIWAAYSARQAWEDEEQQQIAINALRANGIWPVAEAASQRLEWIVDEVPPEEDRLYWGWLVWGDNPQSDLDSKGSSLDSDRKGD